MQRYFLYKINNKYEISKDDLHHIFNVMRMKQKDNIEVVYDDRAYLAEVCLEYPFFKIIKPIEENTELCNDVTLIFSLAKGDKIDFVIQKATELGVSHIILVQTERSVVKMDKEDFIKKADRYNKIAKEAAEQSLRLKLPTIEGVYKLNGLSKNIKSTLNYVAYEKEAGDTSISFSELKVKQDVSILIGPEGGLSEKEILLLNEMGFKNVSLGKRILRTETAAVYALSVIANLLEK